MKLRNKKTGEIADFSKGNFISSKDYGFVIYKDGGRGIEYNSLAELNEEWEDYEEPEGWWFIDSDYEPHATNSTLRNLEADREIGNYFETEEDAKKAVEKLRAWKRLKDKGFVFKGVNEDDGSIKTGLTKNVRICKSVEFYEDMELLFGGEE